MTMRMRVQRGTGDGIVSAANAVITYPDGSQAAVLFVRSGDVRALTGLAQVYRAHGALTVNLSGQVPHCEWTSGECLIHDNGVTVRFGAVDPGPRNGGRGMLGAELTAPWEDTDPDWMHTALETGVVWIGLISEAGYERACLANPVLVEDKLTRAVHLPELPEMPVLKLTAKRG